MKTVRSYVPVYPFGDECVVVQDVHEDAVLDGDFGGWNRSTSEVLLKVVLVWSPN